MNSSNHDQLELAGIPHPGDNVLEYLEHYGWSQSDLARRTGLTPKTISEICNGKAPITPTTSLAFEKAFQRPAQFWLGMQTSYDEAEARSRARVRSSEWTEWANSFPLKEMKKLNFSLPEGTSDVESILGFFGVVSPASWASVWNAIPVSYRQNGRFSIEQQAVAAWVRETEIVARGLDLAPFNKQRLLSVLPTLRRLTRSPADQIMDPVQNLCAACGVAVVWVPELKGTRISGCARWLSDTTALIGLTLRYKTDDQLWFTLFHEIGHLLLHRGQRSFVIDNARDDPEDSVVDSDMQRFEAEADWFSATTLVPQREYQQFISKRSFSNESLHDFAEAIDVGPGIVVGRLQHDHLLKRHQGNALKQKLDFGFAGE